MNLIYKNKRDQENLFNDAKNELYDNEYQLELEKIFFK